MIARIPYQLPILDRPFILLAGSRSGWIEKAARDLERTFESVAIADPRVDSAGNPDASEIGVYLHVLYACLDVAAGILVWLDDAPFWQWLELGRMIERCPQRIVLGMPAPPNEPDWHHAGHAKFLYELRGFHVWDNIEDAITSAKQLRRRGD